MQLAVRLCAIAIAAAIATAAALFPYFLTFRGSLSLESSEWGAFGSYASGVTAPLLAFASLIAVLYTIHVQGIEIRRTATATVRASELQRLSGLVALHAHYQTHIENQGRLSKLLAGTSGQSLANERIADLDSKLRAVMAEIEYFHAKCLERTAASQETPIK